MEDFLALSQALFLLRRQGIPPPQVLPNLRLTCRRKPLEPLVIREDPLLFLGRQIPEAFHETGRVRVLVWSAAHHAASLLPGIPEAPSCAQRRAVLPQCKRQVHRKEDRSKG